MRRATVALAGVLDAYHGRGTIDCGPGVDTVRLRRLHPTYSVKGCEKRRYF